MSGMLKINNLEKKTRRAVTFEDGLWDIYFGLALIFAGFYAHYKITPFILMTPILIIAVSLAKHYITFPRMGYARIKLPALKRVLIWILLLLIPFVIISPVLYKLSTGDYDPATESLSRYLISIATGLAIGIMLAIVAQQFAVKRFYLYALFIAVFGFVMALPDTPAKAVFFLGISALIAIGGIIRFVRFLNNYPLPKKEVTNEVAG
jgi:hypothetical protein